MKSFIRFALVAVLVLSLGFVLSACSSSGGGGGGGAAVSTPTTTIQASQAASSGTQGANMGSGSATTFQNLGQIGISSAVGAPSMKIAGAHTLDPGLAISNRLSAKLAKSKALNKAVSVFKKAKNMRVTQTFPATTIACADGGTVTVGGTFDDTALTYDLTLTAANCREDGTVTDGSIEIIGSVNAAGTFNMTEHLGTDATHKLTILEFSDLNYSVLVSKMETLITITMGGTVDLTTEEFTSVTFGANGSMDVTDYLNQGTYDMTFTNMSIVISDTVATTGIETVAITINGAFSESWTDTSVTPNVANTVSMSFSSFRVSDVYASASATAFDESITGSFSIDYTPNDCLEGLYSFETVTAIHYDSSGMTTAGKLKINNVVEVVFNSNGTITVTFNNTVVYSGGAYGLAEVCEFQTLDEPAPTTSGSTGSTTGDNMTITLSWNGPGGVSASDMDLHMNYYAAAAPTASTVGTSYVDWHGNDSCLSGYSGMDLAGDGTCEIALDFDDTDGYGPEHITASSLPAGYYVVSVNSYGLYGNDTSQTVTVSIQIGSSVFGPFTNTFTTADSEGTTASAWFAVADIVVSSSGSVTVQAHNSNLQLWHDVAFGIATPALRTKGIR